MSDTFGPVTLLSSVTVSGAGSSVDLGDVFDVFTVIFWVTGSGPASAKIEGSHDGTHRVELTSLSVGNNGTATTRTGGYTTGVPYVRYIQGNCTSVDSGVTATLTAVAAQSV